jgi:hypothetical protein
MTTDYRAELQRLVEAIKNWDFDTGSLEQDWSALDRAEAALAQPEPVTRKLVVDYSRVPEIATEAQIRSAAQYLVKKRNCAGDLIPAIEYAIARWGTPAIQPVPVSERLPQGRCLPLGGVCPCSR